MPGPSLTPAPPPPDTTPLRRFLTVFGPGLLVMLADSDVGSVITAGQSGAQWGYHLLPLQLVLIPVLIMVQELTVRLAIFTGRGHGALIRDTFGLAWAWISVICLAIACTGALLTELSGVAGVGELYGLPHAVTVPVAAMALLGVVLTGSYQQVERIAIAVGLFELAFFIVAWAARPAASDLWSSVTDMPLRNPDYLYLVAANIGSVVVPWMVFYQQSALAGKRLGPEHLTAARWDTAIGAVLTQSVMAAVVVACAATIGHTRQDPALSNVADMARALTPMLGTTIGNLVFSLGILGAATVAAIVVSLAFAWGLAEISGPQPSSGPPQKVNSTAAKRFRVHYALLVVSGAMTVAVWPDLVSLSLAVQVMNTFMLPVVLGILISLAVKALPRPHRLSGLYLCVVVTVAAATCVLGILGGLSGTRLGQHFLVPVPLVP